MVLLDSDKKVIKYFLIAFLIIFVVAIIIELTKSSYSISSCEVVSVEKKQSLRLGTAIVENNSKQGIYVITFNNQEYRMIASNNSNIYNFNGNPAIFLDEKLGTLNFNTPPNKMVVKFINCISN